MEAVACLILIGIVWILSATVLLPFVLILKFSKRIREKWFALFYAMIFQIIMEPQVLPLRKKLFELLKKSLSQQEKRNIFNILEIGAGPGNNLPFYPENSHLTVLDKNGNFFTHFYAKEKKYPHIVYERTVKSFAEDMNEIDDCSMDIVISTYVFCSVTSTIDALKEVKRVLKPGGKFLFLEHVKYPKSGWGFTLQYLISPLWKIYFSYCHLLRDPENLIKNAGFSSVTSERVFPNHVIFFCRPMIYGIATK